VVVVADPEACSVQFDPIGKTVFNKSCDIAKSALAKSGVSYRNEAAPQGAVASIRVGDTVLPAFDGTQMADADFKAASARFASELKSTLIAAGYPEKADPTQVDKVMVLAILVVLVIYVTMVYGPIAAWLIELFPTRIRYTSMSLPYHIGNGWFGGFLPTTAFALVAFSGDIYFGLWYPIVIALMTAVLGALFLPETKDVDISK
jgi:hypothetical protein